MYPLFIFLLSLAPSLLKRFVPFGGTIATNSVNFPTVVSCDVNGIINFKSVVYEI